MNDFWFLNGQSKDIHARVEFEYEISWKIVSIKNEWICDWCTVSAFWVANKCTILMDFKVRNLRGFWDAHFEGILRCTLWGDFEMHTLRGVWDAQFEGCLRCTIWGKFEMHNLSGVWDAQFKGILGCKLLKWFWGD